MGVCARLSPSHEAEAKYRATIEFCGCVGAQGVSRLLALLQTADVMLAGGRLGAAVRPAHGCRILIRACTAPMSSVRIWDFLNVLPLFSYGLCFSGYGKARYCEGWGGAVGRMEEVQVKLRFFWGCLKD